MAAIDQITESPQVCLTVAPCLWVTRHRGFRAFLALEGSWRRLVEESGTRNPFLSWEWVSEWGRAFWNEQLVTLVVEGPSGAVAIAPFHRYAGLPVPGLRRPSLELMGPRRYRQVFELGEALVLPRERLFAFSLILSELRRTEPWSWLEISGYGEAGEDWEAAAAGQLRMVDELRQEVPVMALADSWEELRLRLRRNLKESIRRAYNAPLRDGLQFSYAEHRSPADVQGCTEALFSLHAARSRVQGHRRHGDYFANPVIHRFIEGVSRRLAEGGRLNFGVVSLEGRAVAVRLQIEMNGALYLYHSGFDPELWQYNVSTLAVIEGVKAAIAHGMSEISFSLGVDQAKARWDVQMIPFRRLQMVRRRHASRLVFALYQGLRRGRQARRDRARPAALPIAEAA
jgi:CelD/BcsL family acetyltransferase involved in cellulose biosynthesis